MAHRIEHAPHVDVEDAAIFRFGCLIERAFPFDAGIVKRDVEPPEFLDSEIDHRFDVGIFRDVTSNKRGVAAELLNFGNDLRAFFFTPAGQHNLRARASECDRGGFTDAGGSSGYECNFA